MNIEKLKKRLIQLHPWHMKIDICDGLSTAYTSEIPESDLPAFDGFVSFEVKKEREFKDLMSSIYRDGMNGKTFLDCGCNCGAYCFWAKDLGCKKAFGFDIRDHWIKQANFLRKHMTADTKGVSFKKLDLYDFPKWNRSPFDVTYFRGIFYHLPDPVAGLKIAAEATRELLYLDTATMEYYQPEDFSGGLMASYEGTNSPMSGTYGLNWYPTGHKVLRHILSWLGFCEVKVIWHLKDENSSLDQGILAGQKGRIALLASKVEGLLDNRKDIYPQ